MTTYKKMETTKKGVPKRDGSGQGARKNRGRGGCLTPTNKGLKKNTKVLKRK